ncbi:MAG: competence protein CoiA family protein [Leptospirales bacterium]
MSEWGAIEPFGEAVTSYEFRDEYLREGVIRHAFFCPFCGIMLDPVLIYKDGECGKSPYFRHKPGHNHISPCDGAPKNVQTIPPKAPPVRSVDKSILEFPEELIAPRKPLATIKGAADPTQFTTPEEIERRRNEAGQSLGPARYRTSLLRSIAEAFQKLMEEYKDRISTEGIELAKKWLEATSISLPLTIYGIKRNYKTAIQTTKFFPSGRNPERIFRGFGVPVQTENGFEILNKDECKIGEAMYPVSVIIGLDLTSEPSMKISWTNTFEVLKEFSAKNINIHWFCFGKMEKDGSRYVIRVESWDHLYLKK